MLSMTSLRLRIIATASFMIFSTALTLSAQALTKKQAYDRLISEGPKWRLTESLPIEAESKLKESLAKTRPLFQFGMTQYAARINPIQFGINQATIDTVGFGTTALEMRWAILDPVAYFERMSAETQLSISRGQAKQYQTDLTALMLIQYLTVQKLKSQLATIEVSAKRSSEILKLAKKKHGVGAGIPLDVTRARSLSELDRIKKLQLLTKYSKAVDDLALLLGYDKLPDEVDALKFRPVKIGQLKAELSKAPSIRGDLQNANAGVNAARKLSLEASSNFFPKLSILGDIGSTNTNILGLPPERATGFLGVRLEIPLETGGLLDAKRQSAAALSMKAEAQEAQTRIELQNQMKEAVEQVEAALEAVQVAQAYVKSTEEEAAFVAKRFEIGSGNVLDVLGSHNNVATARDTEIDAIFALESAQVGLFRTTGSFENYFNDTK